MQGFNDTEQVFMEPEMLPPTEAHVATIADTPFLAQPTEIPGLLGTLALAYLAARVQRPGWSRIGQLFLTAAWFSMLQAAYVLHSVGHIGSARRVGAPMDSVMLLYGLQSTLYLNGDVTPRQHIGRAAGGPIISSVLTITAVPLYVLLHRVPLLGELAEIWTLCNALILAGAVLPTPHFDMASILKWSVAQRTGEEALGDEAVQQVGSLAVAVLFGISLWLVLRGQWRLAGAALITSLFAAADLYVLKGKLT